MKSSSTSAANSISPRTRSVKRIASSGIARRTTKGVPAASFASLSSGGQWRQVRG
jgi:hypothetical protein